MMECYDPNEDDEEECRRGAPAMTIWEDWVALCIFLLEMSWLLPKFCN